jgi:hypothetical protein
MMAEAVLSSVYKQKTGTNIMEPDSTTGLGQNVAEPSGI